MASKKFSLIIFTASIAVTLTHSAAVATIPFFRSSASKIPSGYENLETLEKFQVSSAYSHFSKVLYQNQVIDVDRKDLLMDTDLSSDKNLSPYELGYAINLAPTFLRSSSNWKSDVVYHLAEKTLLTPIGILGNWIKVSLVSNPQIKGYIEISSLILKHDFAKYIWHQNAWKAVKYRQNGDMILIDGSSVPVFAINSILTDPSMAIMTAKMKGARVRLQSEASQQWMISQLQGHGKVYWHRPKNPSVQQKEILTREQLLNRNIFSYAMSEKNKDLVMVSADGIYLSEDGGSQFKKLSFFNNQNFHVSISAYDELFVGPYISNNKGKDFKPWLKIEELLKASKSIKNNPTLQNAMIKDIQRSSPSAVKFRIENGLHSYLISGNFRLDKAQDLSIQKSRH